MPCNPRRLHEVEDLLCRGGVVGTSLENSFSMLSRTKRLSDIGLRRMPFPTRANGLDATRDKYSISRLDDTAHLLSQADQIVKFEALPLWQ